MEINQKHPYYNDSVEDTLQKLQSGREGLSEEEAKKRLDELGPNELTGTEGTNPVLLFLKQFKDVLILILFLAAGVAWYADHKVDVYVILGVILFNAVLGFMQEYRAEKAILALKSLIKQNANVMRNGKVREIEAKDLVPGDVIVLEEGDGIPADARIISQKSLRAEEASLTGESVPTDKKIEALEGKINLGDRVNMLWKGTHIARGSAKAVVTGTGQNTEIGKISESLGNIKPEATNFSKKTARLGQQMAVIAVATSAVVFVLGYFFRDYEFQEILLLTVATLVSSIPEGLPAVISIVLAIGARRMANQNAIIRETTATEMLGSVTVILTDKTGTITQSILSVKRIFLGDGSDVAVSGSGYAVQGSFKQDGKDVSPNENPVMQQLLLIASLCNNARLSEAAEAEGGKSNTEAYEEVETKAEGKDDDLENQPKVSGDPSEVALLVLSKKAEAKNASSVPKAKRIDDLPFSSDQKFRASLIEREGGKRELLAVGAPEQMLKRCNQVLAANGPQELTEEHRQQIQDKMDEWTNEAMRLLGLTYKEVGSATNTAETEHVDNLIWVGVTGIVDPPRQGVQEAIESCKTAGIRVIMVTGDHKNTGAAIAREVGIVDGSDSRQGYPVAMQEDELEVGKEEFDKIVQNVSVFTRVSPNTKLRIAEHLQQKGHLIAMTGDGVNDAPALKRADVGIAMGIRGTDVAKDAAKIVLSDDNFATIVRAIREGRIVFQNVRQTSFYLLTTNFAFALVFILAIGMGWPFPLTATQILWVNLVTDGIMELGLATERGQKGMMKERPVSRDVNILDRSVIPFLIIMSVTMLFVTLGVFRYYLGQNEEIAHTAVFIVISMLQVFNTFNMRSLKDSVFKIGIFSNRNINIAFIVSLALQLVVIYTPFLSGVFRFEELPFVDLLILIALSTSVVWVAELYKLSVLAETELKK
ncbi:cation-translocating P-type ATPase [Pontibacter silvestris]|uniref:Cation-translocating P-type ATPase n=1 Tax=Pontibacter silvestris TaxID=2305183 RepID=A0ABW4WTB0_9BACT|nr:HAD-IC family P-type ATPase [Pontibacter silvestris]MCC9138006.1 HAD-IC family P-type ATPase [Pontibacter silvestris]